MGFDLEGARKAGYSDGEIAEYLGKDAGFDVAAATKAGYQPSEIIGLLSSRQAGKPAAPAGPASPAAPAEEPAYSDPSGTGASEIMAAAQPARSSVLEGTVIPEQKFDPAEANRLSNRSYAENTRQPGTVDTRQSLRPEKGPIRSDVNTDRGGMLSDSSMPVRMAAKALAGGAQGLGGVVRAAGDLAGLPEVAKFGDAAAGGAEKFEAGMGNSGPIAGFGPKSPAPYLKDMAEGAGSSLTQSAALAAMFGPGAVIPAMSVMTAGQEYQQAREKGMEPGMALAGAVPKGIFEAVGEKFTGLDKVAGAMGTLLNKGASDAAKRTAGEVLLRSGIKEIPGEVITYLGQTGTDLIPGIGLKQDLTMKDFVDGLRDTVVQAGMMGGAMAGGGHAAVHGKAADKPVQSAQDLIRTHWGDAFLSTPKVDPVAKIASASTVDEAIAAAQSAVSSTSAVDNIQNILAAQGLASNPAATPNQQAQAAIESIAQTTPETVNGIPETPQIPTPAASATALDAPAAPVAAGNENLPGSDGTVLDAVRAQPDQGTLNGGSNVTNTAPGSAAQAEATGLETPAPAAGPAVGPAATGTPTRAAALETPGVDPRLVPVSKRGFQPSNQAESPDGRAQSAIKNVATEKNAGAADAAMLTGEKLDKDWHAFADDSGSLGIPRADMPQIKAEHRGAMVNFLNAREITHRQEEVPASSLKPTQTEFSQAKVEKALGFTGNDRSILVSSDNHVLDGHHQWLAKVQAGEPVKIIRLDAPIKKLLEVVREFPSAATAAGVMEQTEIRNSPAQSPSASATVTAPQNADKTPTPQAKARSEKSEQTASAQASANDTATARAPQGKQVSFYPGKYGKGMGKEAAKLEAQRLNRVGAGKGITYTAEEHNDPKLENPYAVVGRKAEPPSKQPAAQSPRAESAINSIAEEKAPKAEEPQLSRAAPEAEKAQQATETLDAAGITGKERIEALKDVKSGAITPEELKAAYPTKGDQTDTPAFKKWFSDSVVTDTGEPDGKPLVMYHGTSQSQNGEAFDSFDTYASNYRLMGMGGYFTADPAIASSYTQKGRGDAPSVYKVFLSIKNPIDMEAKADAAAWKKQFDGIEDYHESGETNESWYRAAEDMITDQEVPKWEGAEIMQEGLRAMGFDGITHMGGNRVQKDGPRHRVYVAFDPEQIKSATGNNGKFDASNPGIQFSRESTDTPLKAMSKLDDLFALPKSQADTVEAITAANDPDIKVKRGQDMAGSTEYTFTMKDGSTATMTVRKPNRYGPSVYAMDLKDGEGSFDTTRPGENPEDVPDDKEDVYINVADLKTGANGNKIYNIAATFAHNTDRIFIGDPAGLSDAAMRRRLENMISSALKFGTTDHLAPHPRQVEGDPAIGMPALEWVYGDSEGNVERMIDASVKATENVFPTAKNLEYDLESRTFRNAINGRVVPFADLVRLDTNLRTVRERPQSPASQGQVGWRTLARNALYRAVSDAAKAAPQSDGRTVLDRLGEHGAGLATDPSTGRAHAPEKRVFYSEQRAAVRNPSTVERVQAAVAELIGGKQLPNKLGRVVATTASEIKSTWEPILGQNLEIGSEGDAGVAQGFYDPKTKTVFIIADHISQGSETAVLAHELMHKHGQAVLGEAGWNKLHDVLNTWKDAPEGSDEHDVYTQARRKVEAVGLELSSQEMFPYAVEVAIKMGIKPSLIAKKGTVARWLGSVKFAMQAAWEKITGKPETFKAQDLVNLAFGIAQRENPEHAGTMGEITDAPVKTDSPAFQKWFGDSKVVDAAGKPLVVYHYSGTQFNEFKNSSWGGFKPIYFNASQKGAKAGARDKKIEYAVYLSMQNPVNTPETPIPWGNAEAKAEQYVRDGFDGVYVRDEGGVSIAVFQPAQIKSAIGNNGEFDAANPDIRFSRTPAPGTKLSPWKDETGRLQFAPGAWLYDKIGTASSPMLVKLGLKAATPELRRQLRQMKIDVEKAQETALSIAKETSKLSDDERKMVSDLVEQELKVGVIPPAHAIKLAAMINDAMGRQTDELVNLGMLTKDTADKWRGKYLPRYYESKLQDKMGNAWADALKRLTGRQSVMKGIKGKNLKGRGLYETIPEAQLKDYEALGWEVRDPDYTPSLPSVDGTVQVWRDFTPAEREKMGEIRDAGFRFVMGYMQTQRDIAVGRMFERMAQDPEQSSRLEKPGYVQVPTTVVSGTGAKVYGKLAGRWVPTETMSQLSNIEESTSEAWQMYRKAMAIWKEGKTALNPVSHVNNMVSNLTMAHLAGVSYHRGDKYIAAARDFLRPNKTMTEAKENGLFLGTLSDTELMNSLPDELKLLAQKQESKGEKVARTGFNILTMFLRKPMGVAYQAEDTFFRYLIYKDAREHGMEPQDAVDYAQKYIFTYDDLPKGARRIRDFGIPFFSYTYKAVPALLHTALTHPLRMAAPAAVLWGINAAAYAIAAGDDDDSWQETLEKYLKDPAFRAKAREKEKLEREHLPPWMKGTTSLMTPKTLRLGMDEVTKLPLFIDISRIIPGGDLFDVSPNAGGLPVPQPITPSHPLFTTAVAMLGNKDLFLGKDIVDSNDTKGEAASKRAAWLWSQLTPAIAAGGYHWNRGMSALAQANGGEITWVPDLLGGDATGIGKDGNPVQPKYAAMQTFGIKVRPIDLETAESIENSMKKKLIRDIDGEIHKLQRLASKGAISDRTLEKERDKAIAKKENIRNGLTVDGNEKD